MSNATPRLTIVLPAGPDDAHSRSAFEDTLVSVLENRTSGCEVVVVHDGSYQDPFEIGDEVRFATAESDGLIDGIAAGCDAAWGRYVHVLSAGFEATEGWCEPALDAFSDAQVASVATSIVARQGNGCVAGEPVAAGWEDTSARLMNPREFRPVATAGGVRSIQSRRIDRLQNGGVYLEASFWRREVLRSLTRACGPTETTIATYAYANLCRAQNWKNMVAAGSIVTAGDCCETINDGGFGTSRTLRSIRHSLVGGSRTATLMAGLRGLLSDPTEAIGNLSVAISPIDVRRWFELDQVYTAQQYRAARRVA